MKKYVYPVVLFADEKKGEFTMLFPDLDIVASGTTVEDAFIEAEDFLRSYLEFSSKMGNKVVAASTFEEVKMMNPKRIVLLASVTISEELKLTKEEEEYKNFLSQYLVDVEEDDE